MNWQDTLFPPNARRNDPPVGFVTRFAVRSAFAQRYEIQVVGREKEHQELWIPAEEVDDLNANLVRQIEVIAHFVGSGFTGEINPQTHLPTDWQ